MDFSSEVEQAREMVQGLALTYKDDGVKPTLEAVVLGLASVAEEAGEPDSQVAELRRSVLFGWFACDEFWHGSKP